MIQVWKIVFYESDKSVFVEFLNSYFAYDD